MVVELIQKWLHTTTTTPTPTTTTATMTTTTTTTTTTERVDAVYGCKYCAIVGAIDWIGASSWVVLVDVGEKKGER